MILCRIGCKIGLGMNITPHVTALALSIGSLVVAEQQETTPLSSLVQQGEVQPVTEALAVGVDVNQLDEDGETLLNLASKCGDEAMVRALLAAGADVNKTSRAGIPPLLVAIARENELLVQLLLEAGAEANAVIDGEPLIYIAVKTGLQEMARILLAHGANPNTPNADGVFALAVAAQENQEDAVKYLLDAGADANATFRLNGRRTALCVASQHGHAEIVKLLLAAGADPRGNGTELTPPLLAAAQNDYVNIMQLLLEAGASVDDSWLKNGKQVRAMDLAMEYKRAAAVRCLLDAGVNPNTPDHSGRSHLGCAVAHNSEELIEMLLAAGADPNLRLAEDMSPLDVAALQGTAKTLKRLLAAGAKPNSYNKDGFSALTYALLAGRKDVAPILIEAGALEGELPENAFSPITAACRHEMLDLVRLFISKGFSVNAVSDYPMEETDDSTGKTTTRMVKVSPLLMAIASGNQELVKILLRSGADPNGGAAFDEPPFFMAVKNKQAEISVMLLAAGASPDAADADGNTVFMYVVRNGSPQLIEHCLKSISNIDARNKDGYFALGFAAERGDLGILRMLLDAGADATHRAGDVMPLLCMAVLSQNTEMVRYLLDKGMDVTLASTKQGLTPFLCAATQGNHEMIALLMGRGANPADTDIDGWSAIDWCIYRYSKHASSEFLLHDIRCLLAIGVKPTAYTENVLNEVIQDTLLRMEVDALLFPKPQEPQE